MKIQGIPKYAFTMLIIAVVACAPQEVTVNGELTSNQIKEFTDELIDKLVAGNEFSGSVLIAKDREAIYTRAAGEASQRYGVENRIDTKFNLGSMNKMLTGVAIMQLAQEGKLSVEDAIGKHLPDYPNEAVRAKVTIHHLLTHTSGMGMYWRELFEDPYWIMRKTTEDFAELTYEQPLAFEPGEQFQYSNCGPIVVGLLIEKISGQSYDDYIREHVTSPTGMENTDTYDLTKPVPNLATGYTRMNLMGEPQEELLENYFITPSKGGPAGGGYSTVEDLLRFANALQGNLLLDQAHVELLTTGKVERNPEKKYAYYFEEELINGHRVIGHGGGAAGINSDLRIYTDLGYTVAVMTNYDPPAAQKVAGKLKELLTGSGSD
ncbi:serine hydrolase domain-containing protein [Candidatus Neomarinimicrobiota bacterium]